jgi:hypothetical protein
MGAACFAETDLNPMAERKLGVKLIASRGNTARHNDDPFQKTRNIRELTQTPSRQ